jgi:hypothetical protein
MTNHTCEAKQLDLDALTASCRDEVLEYSGWVEVTCDPGDPICRTEPTPLPEPGLVGLLVCVVGLIILWIKKR